MPLLNTVLVCGNVAQLLPLARGRSDSQAVCASRNSKQLLHLVKFKQEVDSAHALSYSHSCARLDFERNAMVGYSMCDGFGLLSGTSGKMTKLQGAQGWTWRVCTKLRMQRTMRKVVDESRPVLISSRNSVFLGPTTISPGTPMAG